MSPDLSALDEPTARIAPPALRAVAAPAPAEAPGRVRPAPRLTLVLAGPSALALEGETPAFVVPPLRPPRGGERLLPASATREIRLCDASTQNSGRALRLVF